MSLPGPSKLDPENSAEQRQHIDIWLKYLKQNELSCAKEIEAKRKELREYDDTKHKITDLNKKLEKSVFIPIGRMAFLPGTLDHTNEYYPLIGDNIFVRKSSHRTVELLERRKDAINDHLKKLEDESKLVEQRTKFAEQLAGETASDLVEIREPYDETTETGALRRQKSDKVTRTEHEEMMRRLDKLELREQKNQELRVEDGSDETVKLDDQDPSPTTNPIEEATIIEGKPSQISNADYQKLLKYLEAQDDEDDDETIEEDDDEEYDAYDSDDQEQPMQKQPDKPSADTSKSTVDVKPVKKGVRFSDTPLGPSASTCNEERETPVAVEPKPILKPIDHVPRVDRQAVEAMDRREKSTILPESKNVFTGAIRERDPLQILPEIEQPPPSTTAPKVSRFKAKRVGM